LGVLAWDGENRMISSTVGTSATTYLYDAQSRRIVKTTGGNSTLYVYDGWNCIAEYAGATLSKTRLWGTDLSGSMQGAGGVGGLLAERHHSGTVATYHPTYDGNGNVSEYLDSSGQVTAHFEYDPFGNTVVASGSIGLFDYRFSTKPRDSETGLYYYTYRYYDPVTGRWPSRDPIEEEGGINLYGFVGNDGVGYFDPLGLSKCCPTDNFSCDDCREQCSNCPIQDKSKCESDCRDAKLKKNCGPDGKPKGKGGPDDNGSGGVGGGSIPDCQNCTEVWNNCANPVWDVFKKMEARALELHSKIEAGINAEDARLKSLCATGGSGLACRMLVTSSTGSFILANDIQLAVKQSSNELFREANLADCDGLWQDCVIRNFFLKLAGKCK
jgi:RHS repeat-associated protein